jgi:histone deacetylase 6
MLEEHLPEVQALLLEKKHEYEEMNDVSSRTDEQVQLPLKSPPRAFATKFANDREGMGMGMAVRSPKGPPVGLFSVSPSPRSPLKRAF